MWGDPWDKPTGTGGDICLDLILLQHNELEQKIKTPILVYGTENFNRLTDMGFNCVIIEKKNSILPPENTLLHKLLGWEIGMKMFDTAICLDIDCHQVRELPKEFWSIHARKSTLQIPPDRVSAPLCHVEEGRQEHHPMLLLRLFPRRSTNQNGFQGS